MQDVSIKPCPHCGGSACLYSSYSSRHRLYFVFVKCDICGAQGKAFTSNDDPAEAGWSSNTCDYAVGAWNMRTSSQEG